MLVDTSVWGSYFRQRNENLVDLLERNLFLTHPMIRGELVCRTLPDRSRMLGGIALLQAVREASRDEMVTLIEREKLFGCGLVDISSRLASTLITTGARLWTADKCLAELAGRFGVLWQAGVVSGSEVGF